MFLYPLYMPELIDESPAFNIDFFFMSNKPF